MSEVEHWESTAGIARLFDRPAGTIRRWAHEDGWRRRGTSRTRQWWYADASASADRRVGLDKDERDPNSSASSVSAVSVEPTR